MINYKNLTDPGAIVAQRRQDLSLSQAELATKLRYANVNFISMMESGRSKVPIERALDVANMLEVEPRWFIERVIQDRYPKIAHVIFGAGRSAS